MSPAVFDSQWVSFERSTALFRNPTNSRRQFLPVLLRDTRLPDSLSRYRHIDYRKPHDAAYLEILHSLKRWRTRFAPATLDAKEASLSSGLYSRVVARLRESILRFETIAHQDEHHFHIVADCTFMFRVRELSVHMICLGLAAESTAAGLDNPLAASASRIPDRSLTILLARAKTVPEWILPPCAVVDPNDFLSDSLRDDTFRASLLRLFPPRYFNPYQSAYAVEKRMFFGRNEETLDLLRGDNSAVVGPRRVGKSSLALHIRHYLRTYGWKQQRSSVAQARVTVAYVDVGALASPEDLWSAIIADMPLEERDLSRGSLRRAVLGTREVVGRSDYEILRHLVHRKYRPFILLLDEVDALIHTDPKWRVFSRLRALFDDLRGEGKLILFGYKALYRVHGDQRFPLYGRLSLRRLEVLSGADVNSLIERPITELGISMPDFARLAYQIHMLTGGLPHLVQDVCRSLVDDIEGPLATLTAGRALESLERRSREISYRIDRLIHALPDGLPKFIALTTSGSSVLRVEDVRIALQGQYDLTVPAFVTRDAMEELYLDNILRPGGEEDTYVHVSELIRRALESHRIELSQEGLLEVFASEVRDHLAG